MPSLESITLGRLALCRPRAPGGHLVLRGSNFSAEAIASVVERLEKADARPQILVDSSHGNSDEDTAKQAIAFRYSTVYRKAGTRDMIDCTVESYLNSDKQALNGDASNLEYGISITDACIGWGGTEPLLTWACDAMGKQLRVSLRIKS